MKAEPWPGLPENETSSPSHAHHSTQYNLGSHNGNRQNIHHVLLENPTLSMKVKKSSEFAMKSYAYSIKAKWIRT